MLYGPKCNYEQSSIVSYNLGVRAFEVLYLENDSDSN